MKSPARIIRQWLIDDGEGSSSGQWTVTVATMPDNESINDALAVFDVGQNIQGRNNDTGTTTKWFNVTIRARSDDYKDAYQKLAKIAKALDEIDKVAVQVDAEDFTIQSVFRGQIRPDGRDKQRRPILALNAQAVIE